MNKRQRTSEQPGQPNISRQILVYLIEHPRAQDTLEGILHWWLLEQQIMRGKTQVQEALAELLAQGWVQESKGRDGQIHYRINRGNISQIRAMLERNEEGQAQPEHNSTTEKDS